MTRAKSSKKETSANETIYIRILSISYSMVEFGFRITLRRLKISKREKNLTFTARGSTGGSRWGGKSWSR